MNYLAFFILFFTMLQLLVSLSNLFWGKFRFKSQTNPEIPVSVMIPARNEEKNIGNILNDLLKQDYTNIEIMVFDDQSDDRTAGMVDEFSKKDNRIVLMKSEGLPVGWIGKNYACHTMASVAKGTYYLFLDADVRISINLIKNTVLYAEKYKTGLLSLFPKQILLSPAEWITVPVMNYILLSLLPLVFVRKSSYVSLAAANGQFMLFDSHVYNKYRPHEKFRKNMVEDIQTARYLKRNKVSIACFAGNHSVMCRMYCSFKEAVSGFSKNIVTYFGNSFLLALLFWIFTSFGFLVIIFGLSFSVFLLYIVSLLTIRIIVSYISEQNVFRNLLYFIPQQLVMGIFIYKALINKLKKQYNWKERIIS